uniref:Uncharacterized protein n=1 Tax=Anguilla anguilla TaxID=7936 RepID=A0A0E9U5P8_ANGAN
MSDRHKCTLIPSYVKKILKINAFYCTLNSGTECTGV